MTTRNSRSRGQLFFHRKREKLVKRAMKLAHADDPQPKSEA
jgi:hypothetical protein